MEAEVQVTSQDIWAAKEARQERRWVLEKRHQLPIVSLTMNIPGPVKNSSRIRALFDYGVEAIKKEFSVVAEERIYPATGPEALVVLQGEGETIKKKAIALEEAHFFARLLDMDVFGKDGRQLSRKSDGPGRSCFICGDNPVACMREQRHSKEELYTVVAKMLTDFTAWQTQTISPAAEAIGAMAVEAMLFEVACTPAPGLVDRVNSGAHRDMDFYTFMSSTAALAGTMARCAQAGLNHQGDPAELMPVLRVVGLEGEKKMRRATAGINTHKGLLFSLGIAAAAAGLKAKNRGSISADRVLLGVKEIAGAAVLAELETVKAVLPGVRTAGQRLYHEYGVTGIRGELAAGMPAVAGGSLPVLTELMEDGLPVNEALVHTLLVLMTLVEDTTVMNRHDVGMMRSWVREKAAGVLRAGGGRSQEGMELAAELDRKFIDRNISPGGAADLLAVTWFLHRLENWEKARPES